MRRLERLGWDRAAARYDALWSRNLAPVYDAVIECARFVPGQRVLDVACGTGGATLAAARRVGPPGGLIAVDFSPAMVAVAAEAASAQGLGRVRVVLGDAAHLPLGDASVDAALCVLGLMYMSTPTRALAEMHRTLRPGGSVVLAVWGETAACGASVLVPIVDDETADDVCPPGFALGAGDALVGHCAAAGLQAVSTCRLGIDIEFADGDELCEGLFLGGALGLAWSRFDAATRRRVRRRLLDATEPWCVGLGYRIPAEVLIVRAVAVSESRDP
jgi:SAM-dependent methyltransferase